MGLTNITFFVFCLISLFLYYIVPRKYSYIILLLSSIYFLFYNDFTLSNLIYVLAVYLTSYLTGILIKKRPKDKKLYMLLGVFVILGILIYLKYTNLFINTINILFKTNIALVTNTSPLGLSYFSLMMIGYIINAYYEDTKAEKNPFKLATFNIFFPTLTSGPFIKYEDIKDNIAERPKLDINNIFEGFIRLLYGLFKVLIISTRLNLFVTTIYSDITSYSAMVTLLSIFLYTFELYTNFSGSIDIIMGVSQMFGFTLPENFNNPFGSETITEFWRRWHITLGEWLRNYIFYPLLKSNIMQSLTKKCKTLFGKKGKKIPTFISMFILWLLIGIWHGGEYKYILASGLLQFVFIFFEDITNSVNKKSNKFTHVLRTLRTFTLFSFSMIFFRASSVTEGIMIIKNLANFTGSNILNFLSIFDYIVLGISLVILLVVDHYFISIKENLKKKDIPFKIGMICLLILVVLVFGKYGLGFNSSDFIYGKF